MVIPDDADEDVARPTYSPKPPNPSDRDGVQYALMLDAGSTARTRKTAAHRLRTRTHQADGGGARPLLLRGVPTRSRCVVPFSLRKCTPIGTGVRAVKATAVLRLLGPRGPSPPTSPTSTPHLHAAYLLALPDKAAVSFTDGADEGVFAGVIANYILETVLADSPPDTTTFGVLDLASVSTQIDAAARGQHKYHLTIEGKTCVPHQYSTGSCARERACIAPRHTVNNSYLSCGTQRTVMLVVAADAGMKLQVTMHCADAGGGPGNTLCETLADLCRPQGCTRTSVPTRGRPPVPTHVGRGRPMSDTVCGRVSPGPLNAVIVDFAPAKDAVCAGRPYEFGGRVPARAFPASAGACYCCTSVTASRHWCRRSQLVTLNAIVAQLATAVCMGWAKSPRWRGTH
ncbi:hypothetical protein DFH06DRAFT_1332079 [Mycena polygramma]|nr:hypothetical protein DFH06DRAFT_1332079 [Mycena polygramma]